MTRRLSRADLAVEAGVDEGTLDRLLDVDALSPGADGLFEPGDAAIVGTLAALLDSGVSAEDLRWLLSERSMRFNVIARLYADLGPRSPRSIQAVDASLAPDRGEPVERLYAALGLPVPGADTHLPATEDALIDDYLRDWLAVDPTGDASIRVARALRDAVARVSDTWLDTWDEVARPSITSQGAPAGVAVPPGADDANPTIRMAEVARRLLPMLLDRALQARLNERIVAVVERTLIEAGRVPARPERPAAVAFVDLSGFTTHTVEAGDEAALSAADRLREIAERRVGPVGGRVVKVLGDGVLLLFPDPASAVSATLAIVGDCGSDGTLPAHAAIAAGRVIRREGDVFGATVNLAARLLAAAAPGEVVVEEGVVVALPRGTARFAPRGRVEIRGLPMPVAVWRATPAD